MSSEHSTAFTNPVSKKLTRREKKAASPPPEDDKPPASSWGRPHERILFGLYTGLGLSALVTKTLTEGHIAIAWASFVSAISFTEAWVKFQAPFLQSAVAVDVGRHVFAALQAVEGGLMTSFWVHRGIIASTTNVTTRPSSSNGMMVLASLSLLFQGLVVSPKLYLRAKYKIVNELTSDAPSKRQGEHALLKKEVEARTDLPSRTWHSVFSAVEVGKIVALICFAATTVSKKAPV